MLVEDSNEPKTPIDTETIFGIPIDSIGDKQKHITFSDIAELAILQEHVVEYKSQFPELGATVSKDSEEYEDDFSTEILDAEAVTAIGTEPVSTSEPHVAVAGTWEALKKRQDLIFPLYLAKDEVMEDASEPKTPKRLGTIFGVSIDSIGDKEGPITFTDIMTLANKYLDRQVLKEHVTVYESHFPELGAPATKTEEPETDFSPQLLEAETVALTADVHSDIKPVTNKLITIPNSNIG